MATTNGTSTSQGAPEQYTSTTSHAEASSGNTAGSGDLSKDQVGWYFVEQYYTTLSKSPEKLHLFYSKRSQFVSGLEAEVAPVSVGRAAIQERIRQLDFQDCKVRVSNVDSQASFDNIVIQVIGETSNKSAELKKFVQTFVLAQQPTGYFVLNDIFRYIHEDVEEEAVGGTDGQAPVTRAEQSSEQVEMPQPQTTAADEQTPLPVAAVDEKLQAIEAEVKSDAPAVNGTADHELPEESTPAPEVVEKQVEEEAIQEPEKPQDPLPSPVAAKSLPAAPAAPAKPMSWASRAAAANGPVAPKPAVPAATPRPAVPAQTRAAPAATPKPAAPAAPSPAAQPAPNNEQKDAQNSGWQSVGGDHNKRQNRPQSISGPAEKEGTMGYVRYVTEKVNADELRTTLAGFGELVYFDVNRMKNCAFVEFATPAGYQAATAANPHVVSGENIYVEPRRPKTNAYGGAGYNGPRNGGGPGGMPGGGGMRGGRGGNGGPGGYQQGRGGRGGGNNMSRGGMGPGAGRGGAGAPQGGA